jgi:hypothetical protein
MRGKINQCRRMKYWQSAGSVAAMRDGDDLTRGEQ